MGSAAPRLYLEDLSVGMSWMAGPMTLSEDAIIAFAREFDPQPFHIDSDAANATLFKGLAASGWHTVAISMRLLVNTLPLAGGVAGFGAEVSWPKPVRPGDSLSVRSQIIEIKPSRSKPNQAMVLFRTETLNQYGEVVQVLTSKNLAFKRGYAPGDTK